MFGTNQGNICKMFKAFERASTGGELHPKATYATSMNKNFFGNFETVDIKVVTLMEELNKKNKTEN